MRFVFGLLVTLGLAACAGKSTREEASDGRGGGGRGGGGVSGTESGAVGNISGTGGTTAGGSAGAANGGQGATTSMGGFAGIDCSSPPESGPCDGAFPMWAYDSQTRLCLPFIHGGCGGNANRYPSPEECYGTCETTGGSLAACTLSSECTVIPKSCCGCEPAQLSSVIGINGQFVTSYTSAKCATVDCDACVTPDIGWFTSQCEAQHCIAVDIRETDATVCTSDSDCSLRNGLHCCEACESDASTLVSVSDPYGNLICPDGIPPCPPCPNGGPVHPTGAHPICANGRCSVIYELN